MPQKYLKVYDEHSDYTSKFRLYTPNVSHCREEDEVHYTDGDGDMSSIPLTFEILSDGYIQGVLSNTSVGTSRTIEYKKNNDAGTSISSTSAQIPCSKGDVFQFRGDNTTYGDTNGSGYHKFSVSADFNVLGNIMSLLNSQNYATLKTISSGTHTFRSLFTENTGLQNSNNLILPATTLTSMCYSGIFEGCTNLKNTPTLPATTLASFCYSSMFMNCTSLTTAPDLLATNTAQGCYLSMFKGCSSLNYIKCMLADIGNYTINNGVSGVAPTGTFISNPENTDGTIGTSGIPTGGVTKEHYKSMPLTFKIQSDGNINWFATTSYTVTLEYSKNGGSGTEITSSTGNGTDLSVNTGDVIRFRGNSPLNDGTTGGNCNYFRNTCSYSVGGNVMSLLNKTDFNTMTDLSSYNYAFYDLFYSNTGLTDASNLILPAMTLSSDLTYGNMFAGCTNLLTAPTLPATTLTPRCYWHMFRLASKLNHIECLATNISASNCTLDGCYGVSSTGMFIRDDEMQSGTIGTSGIPTGGIIKNDIQEYIVANGEIETDFQLTNDSYKIVCSYYIPSIDASGKTIYYFNNGVYHQLLSNNDKLGLYFVRYNADNSRVKLVEQVQSIANAPSSTGANVIVRVEHPSSIGYGVYCDYVAGLSSAQNNYPYETWDKYLETIPSIRITDNYTSNTSVVEIQNLKLLSSAPTGTRFYGIKVGSGDNQLLFDGVPYKYQSKDAICDKVSGHIYTTSI